MGSSSNNNNDSTVGGGNSGGVPPGFRFHPTDEELLHYYLKKKVSFHKFEMEVIRDVDLNKLEPWDLQERCRIGSTPQNEWYFFSHKDRKYPTGSRTNRATHAGFWKATGRDKCIRNTFQKIGMRKTLVFYRGRAPHGHKTDWIMHEYRLEDHTDDLDHSSLQEDGWVVCRVFKKKNLFKVGGSANEGGSSSTTTNYTNTNGINMNSSSPLNHHHHHHHHPQLLVDNTPTTPANMHYYDLLRGPNNPMQHHYLIPTNTFQLNDKPDQADNNNNNNNNLMSSTTSGASREHDLALHAYLPQQHYYASAPTNNAAEEHTWHADVDGGGGGGLLHGNNGNSNMISNRLSLGATATTGEMDFWGAFPK